MSAMSERKCLATTFLGTPRPICCLRCAEQCACVNCRAYVIEKAKR